MSDTTSYLRLHPFGNTEFLVGKAKAGSQKAWEAIYQRYRPMLVAHVKVRLPAALRGRVDAEDVLQRTMERAWKGIHGFEYRGENSLRHWLRRLVVNVAVDEIQAQLPELRLREEAEGALDELPSPAQREAQERERARSDVFEALGALEEPDRDLLIQRNFERLTFDEIAAVLECSRESARQRYEQAFERLQKHLQG